MDPGAQPGRDAAPEPDEASASHEGPRERAARSYWQRIGQQKRQLLLVRADAARRRTILQWALDEVARVLAHPLFFVGEIVFHAGWIVLNTGWVPGVTPWDPYPFSFLLGIASIQAFFVGLLILMHTRYEARIGELREETELQVALHAERETTKLLRMMVEVHRKLGIASTERDTELHEMAKPLEPDHLLDETREELDDEEADNAPPPLNGGG